jgi:hypothetical protein
MSRILVLNNYNLTTVWDEVRQGLKPDHHLYGLNYLEQAGHSVEVIGDTLNDNLANIDELLRASHFPIPVGSLEQQSQILQKLDSADLIYSPCQTQSWLLLYLKALGFIDKPIICVAHHPIETGRGQFLRRPFICSALKASTAFPSLSKRVAAGINSLAPGKSKPLTWGPDKNFYPQDGEIGDVIIAVGRTGRDFQTFGLAAKAANVKAHIYCLENDWQPSFEKFGDAVEITTSSHAKPLYYPEMFDNLKNCLAMAIPLTAQNTLAGLTSFVDALALGKPIIMTRNSYIDIDIEKEGIGIWVNPNDVDAFEAAMLWLANEHSTAKEMGKRARALVDNGYNSQTFANEISGLIDEAI